MVGCFGATRHLLLTCPRPWRPLHFMAQGRMWAGSSPQARSKRPLYAYTNGWGSRVTGVQNYEICPILHVHVSNLYRKLLNPSYIIAQVAYKKVSIFIELYL